MAGFNYNLADSQASSGVLVYRRMRVAEVFSYGCRDMKASLCNQLVISGMVLKNNF